MSNRSSVVALLLIAYLASVFSKPSLVQAATIRRNGLPPPRTGLAAATVTGTVVDADTHQPVPGAQISVIGTTIGTVTDAEGHYRLDGIPAGTVTIRARRIGYGSSDRTVTLRDGESAAVDFSLGTLVSALDAVIVTGTTGGTQLRAIGNAVDKLDLSKDIKSSPAINVQQLLGQKSPGVLILPSPGMVGSGSAVRIRGAASLSLTNQPIIYVDGVRVDK